ncbi:hypothetical protein [Rhodopirellula sallentina]|uniref:hypothetical protein n=1 Tax=Rhodopirellula sallentina TaxID=1263869 RepID=UPI00118181AA|nr:hypothetical protein [Rhodopirellula sallentina]
MIAVVLRRIGSATDTPRLHKIFNGGFIEAFVQFFGDRDPFNRKLRERQHAFPNRQTRRIGVIESRRNMLGEVGERR